MNATKTIARSFALNVAKIVVLLAALSVAYMHAEMSDRSDPTAERPFAENTPAAMVAAHDCWTGEAPDGVEAGHVVVTYRGETVYSKRLVDEAVGHVFGERVEGIQAVHGFCR